MFLLGMFLWGISNAQIKNPVQWKFLAKKRTAGTYELHLTATIEKGWHLYSQTTPEGGPVPTRIEFVKNPLVTLIGKAKELGKLEQHHEKLFGVDVKQFSNKVDFVQLVKTKGNIKTSASGNISFMVCNDQECLPPQTVPFAILLQ